jgi:hypothetical protein
MLERINAVLPEPTRAVSSTTVPTPKQAAAESQARQPRRELVKSEPPQTPEWKDTLPQSEAEIYFVGVSHGFATEADARRAAREDAFNQILNYYGRYIQSTGIERSTLQGSSSDILTPYIERVDEIKSFAENVVSQVNTDKYYTELYITEQNKNEYIVYVLCEISRAKAENDIDTFAQKTSERYGSLIRTQNSLAGALEVYSNIYEALRNNPLHRAVAWYDTGSGRAGLYNYCAVQINTIANSVFFAPVTAGSVQKGADINTTVRLSSSLFQSVGSARCGVSIRGNDNSAPQAVYTVGEAGSFILQIHTDKLEAGKYNVGLELLLNEIAPSLRQNPSSGFSFEVTPLNTIRVVLLDDEASNLAPKVRGLLQKQGLLLVESGAAYRARVQVTLNERRTNNYFIVEPTVTVNIELERDGTPLVTYTKNYGEFRHVTRAEALQRAYRNIENDLGGNFASQIKEIGK